MKRTLEKSFKKNGDKKVKQARPRKEISGARLGFILGAGIGLLLSLFLAIYLHSNFIDAVRMDRLSQLAAQRAEIGADSVSTYLDNVLIETNTVADRPALYSTLASGDKAGLEKIKADVLTRIDGALAARFVLFKKAALDPDGLPPISFTQLAMIRAAESRKGIYPEAVRGEKGEWVLNFAIPLPEDSEQDVKATLLLSVSLDSLGKKLVQDKASLGRIFVEQEFASGDPVEVLTAGRGNVGELAFYPVPESYWKIGFHPSFAMLENAKSGGNKIYAIIAVLSLLVVSICVVVGRIAGDVLARYMKGFGSPAAGDPKSDQRTLPSKSTQSDSNYLKADLLDVDVSEVDEELLGLEDVPTVTQEVVDEEDVLDIRDDPSVPDVIFRAYDIRGLAKTQITNALAQQIGQALGSEALDNGQSTLIVARDARLTSPELTEFLIRGMLSTGCKVLNIGTVPTPLMYFATMTLKDSQSGVMVTASHNPKEYNGFKVVMNGKSRSDSDIKAIRKRILKTDFHQGAGVESRYDIVPDYIDTIVSDVALAGEVNIVIDAGNGVTGIVAPSLFEELGCNVVPLFCDLDGNFPNHSPDPSIEQNLQALIEKVKETQADLGVAFDGDGDRLMVVTSSGRVIWPDQLLMLFAKDIVSRNPGADVVFDVKSTRHLAACVTSYGGRPIMWKTGHSLMKSKMMETGALLGGEFSGHIFIKDRWFGFDDGLYAAARLIEILTLQDETLDELFSEFPTSPATPEIRVEVSEEKKFELVKYLAEKADFGEGRLTLIDGVRVDFPYGWGLVRASNTSASLTLRFEADDEDALHKVKSIIVKQLKIAEPSLEIHWKE